MGSDHPTTRARSMRAQRGHPTPLDRAFAHQVEHITSVFDAWLTEITVCLLLGNPNRRMPRYSGAVFKAETFRNLAERYHDIERELAAIIAEKNDQDHVDKRAAIALYETIRELWSETVPVIAPSASQSLKINKSTMSDFIRTTIAHLTRQWPANARPSEMSP